MVDMDELEIKINQDTNDVAAELFGHIVDVLIKCFVKASFKPQQALNVFLRIMECDIFLDKDMQKDFFQWTWADDVDSYNGEFDEEDEGAA